MLDLSYDLFNNTFLMANKLFCTFTAPEELDNTLNTLTTKYTILYSKIFVLESLSTEEYVCTYNIDTFNMEQQSVLPNTILLHRKKESNTLYTINALKGIYHNIFKIIYNIAFPDSFHPFIPGLEMKWAIEEG